MALTELAKLVGKEAGAFIWRQALKLIRRETRDGRSLDFGAGEQGPPQPISHAMADDQLRQARAAAQPWPCAECGGATTHRPTCPRAYVPHPALRKAPPPHKPRK
jgi:hypothetical protein